ncbi:DUF4221 family protein [Cyclobacterium marinum]|uniref:DUF4221 family protein n=1 Tax=Cyclobacterium marinum TaxID=104 RepID=UPI0030DB453F|tara:strand:- start:10125 stop:11276 length:1152 start_codon:yes stop_codon:yes gene_type:complete
MKNVFYLLLIPLLFSCGKESSEKAESGNILEKLTFTVDTVMVDAGDDIFILSSGLGTKALNQDKSKLLFFEREPFSLVQVDLNNLKLIGKTPFQKEGPNSVGTYLTDFQLGPNSELFIQGNTSQAKFTTEGKLTKSLKIVPEGIHSELANNFQKLYARVVFDFEKNRIYAQPTIESLGKKKLYIIDPLSKGVRIEPIPEMKSVEEFSGTLITKSGEGTMYRYFGVGSFTTIENGQLLISSGAMSGIYRLNPKLDSLYFIPIQHQNFPNRMEVTVNNSPTDEAQFSEDRRKVYEQLNYMEPRWDEAREMYMRLGKKTFLGQEKGDPSTFEVFLFAYDQNFNVLGETKIEGLKQVPGSYFWKDGKLWSYINVEDELGFAVIDFKF